MRGSNRHLRAALVTGTLGAVAAAALAVTSATALAPPPIPVGAPPGVESFDVALGHTTEPVSYEQTPPVGGPHAPLWQSCGFYSTPIENEYGVHSLEHGAIWVTYRPDLSSAEIAELRTILRTFVRAGRGQGRPARPLSNLGRNHFKVLISPYPGLPAPVVASSWGYQLRLDSATDPRLAQFITVFRFRSPEPFSTCGPPGVGTPEL